MPPFSGAMVPPSNGFPHQKRDSNIVTIDVGGQLFQTTKQTLAVAGPESLFSRISRSSSPAYEVAFVDRDPELFSVLLSLLRTGTLPSRSRAFDLQDLLAEARFYGIEGLFLASQSNPSQFEAFNLRRSSVLPLSGGETPSALYATPSGSVHVAHGSRITSFDWSLQRKATVLTRFTAVDSLLALSPAVAAAGATDFSGLQILDLKTGFVRHALSWENATRSSSTVQAIASSPEFLFTSFESGRRNSSAIMIYDLGGAFRPVSEIGKNEIYGADLDSAIPATKLSWVSNYGLLMASGSHAGPSGVRGTVKLWDVRSGKAAWEHSETADCFSDVTVSGDLSAMFKVGVQSGEVFYADLRALGGGEPWVCLGEGRRAQQAAGRKEGAGARMESHGGQVFCSRGGAVELWSEVLVNPRRSSEDGLEGRVFRRNFMGNGKEGEGCGGRVAHMKFGGNKMFVTRKEQQSVEVWQGSWKVA